MLTRICLKPLERHVISRDAHHFNNVTHNSYGRKKCVVRKTYLRDLFNLYEGAFLISS